MPEAASQKRSGQGRDRILAALSILIAASALFLGIQSFRQAIRKEYDFERNERYLRQIQDWVAAYHDEFKSYPKDLNHNEFIEKNFGPLPELDLGYFGIKASREVEVYELPKGWQQLPAGIHNSGHWGYDPKQGRVFIDSTLMDPKDRMLIHYGLD